jgi:hypothetical protein
MLFGELRRRKLVAGEFAVTMVVDQHIRLVK